MTKTNTIVGIGIGVVTLSVLSGCIGKTTVHDTTQNSGSNTQGIVMTGRVVSGTNTQTGLSAIQIKQLQYLVEEEKLARDVYAALYAQRNHRKFDNIINSEDNHQQQVQNILQQYGITDPTVGVEVGVFANPELSTLYTQLTQRGLISLSEAMNVGIEIETMDIQDIEKMMPQFEGYPTIQNMLQRLLDGSKRHLQAFSK